MTIGGALSDLNNLLKADDIPVYYKPSIKAVMETIALSSSENPNKWIPVSERLPEENETVIVSTKYGVYPEAKYTKRYGWEWAYEAGCDYWVGIKEIVTAWMPLPKPYKAESKEDRDDRSKRD